MSKITSPLQALEHIRALATSSRPIANDLFLKSLAEAIEQGIASAAPLPTRKAARDLVPGDVLRTTDSRVVVLYAREVAGGRVELTLGVLGEFGAANDILTHAPDSQFTVEAPAGVTPVQAAADRLLDALRLAVRNPDLLDRVTAAALLDELEPPKPPTLDEALDVLRAILKDGYGSRTTAHVAAEALLKRVPN